MLQLTTLFNELREYTVNMVCMMRLNLMMKSHRKHFRIADSSVRTDLSISFTNQIIFSSHDVSFNCAHGLNMISFILVKITVCGYLFQIFSNIYQGCFTGTRYIMWMLERIIPLPVQTEYTNNRHDTISGNHAHIPAMPLVFRLSQIAKCMGPTWGPSGSCRPQMGPMSAPWTLLSGMGLQQTTTIVMEQWLQ